VTYDVVLSDPPWFYYGSTAGWGDAAKFYPLMQNDDVFGLPVRKLMNDRSILFLWATAPKLDVAMKAIQRWDLIYRGVAFVWVKTKLDGTPIGAQGVRPSITKPLTEFVLAASPVAKGRPLKLYDESICQTVFAPRREHSQKPREVQDRIERMYPDASKLAMFSRQPRPGWDATGFDADGIDARTL
jgi:N6-adenosine-specific RNA methylase IME4